MLKSLKNNLFSGYLLLAVNNISTEPILLDLHDFMKPKNICDETLDSKSLMGDYLIKNSTIKNLSALGNTICENLTCENLSVVGSLYLKNSGQETKSINVTGPCRAEHVKSEYVNTTGSLELNNFSCKTIVCTGDAKLKNASQNEKACESITITGNANIDNTKSKELSLVGEASVKNTTIENVATITGKISFTDCSIKSLVIQPSSNGRWFNFAPSTSSSSEELCELNNCTIEKDIIIKDGSKKVKIVLAGTTVVKGSVAISPEQGVLEIKDSAKILNSQDEVKDSEKESLEK